MGRGCRTTWQIAPFGSASERLFITLGEALSQLSKLDSEVAESIADLPRIVGFRNVLVHGYAVIEDDVVWQMAEARVPPLLQIVEGLLEI